MYVYLGDRWTQLLSPHLVGQRCTAVRRADGKCIVGGGKMLVRFEASDQETVVIQRRLRKVR